MKQRFVGYRLGRGRAPQAESVRLPVYVPFSEHAFLSVLARDSQISPSRMVATVLTQWLQQQDERLTQQDNGK